MKSYLNLSFPISITFHIFLIILSNFYLFIPISCLSLPFHTKVTKKNQNLNFSSLHSFITAQRQRRKSGLTFTDLPSNILQQNDINNSMISKFDRSTTHAFYIKGKFSKSPSNQPPLHGRQQSYPRSTSYSLNNSTFSSHSNSSSNKIICHYCCIHGHKAPDCKKRDQGYSINQSSQESRLHTNNFTKEDGPLNLFTAITTNLCTNNFTKEEGPLYLFSAIATTPGTSPCWFLDFDASRHTTPNWSFFHDFQNLSVPRTIILGDNNSFQATGIAIVQIQLSIG